MQKFNLAVFVYHFPHKKTQDFLLRLLIEGYAIKVILAAEKVHLKIPPSSVRTKLRHIALIPPQQIAEQFNIDYRVVTHNSEDTVKIANELRLDIGVIAGARILKKYVIDAFGIGIINFHPGLIPEARGLDSMLWSIQKDIPLGVTSHLIDENIDAGTPLEKREIPIFDDDTIFDLSNRLHELQLDMIKPSVERALHGNIADSVDAKTFYHSKMDTSLEKDTISKLPDYIARHSLRYL